MQTKLPDHSDNKTIQVPGRIRKKNLQIICLAWITGRTALNSIKFAFSLGKIVTEF